MKELPLKYGCNPNQLPAKLDRADGKDLPFVVCNGRPGYINFLDALNSWQLVRELDAATGLPCAASFKHVSPTSAAVGLPLDEKLKKACFVEDVEGLDDSPLACAYARARGTDRLSSFGDWAALSRPVDAVTAHLLKREVSDGVIAPGYSEEALAILRQKKNGNYNIIQIDPAYEPPVAESKEVFGIRFTQKRNDARFTTESLNEIVTKNKALPESAKRDLLVALITLKYTQSNSVCFAVDGQAIGVGAGQQSRIHCTRLAGDKADTWRLRQSDRVLSLPFRKDLSRATRDNVIDQYLHDYEEDVTAPGHWEAYFTQQPAPFTKKERRAYLAQEAHLVLASDAFFPFADNIQRAAQSGVKFIAQPGGSTRDAVVIDAADHYGLTMVFTHQRLFHH